jgi:cytochrome P450
MNMPVVVPRFIPTPANRQLRRARKNLQSVSLRLIETYRKQKLESLEGSLIAHLLQSNLPDEVVEANLRAIFIAGHETTSIALTWAWYLLSQHPEQYDSLVQGENVVGLVREVLRLYPPTWITAREVISPVTFDSFALQPGDLIFVFILAIHHSTKWWGEDVLEFRPDRWSVTYTSTSTPGRWLPFGGGPRVCAGANFALTEMKIFMQTFAQAGGRFTLADPTHVPVPVAGFTRKPKDPLYMKMRFIS